MVLYPQQDERIQERGKGAEIFVLTLVVRLAQIGYIDDASGTGRAQDWVEYLSMRLLPLAVKVRG